MEKREDIFDKIMTLPVLAFFEPFYHQHKQVLMYLLFGGITFFLNIAFYILFYSLWGINELIANILCWILCVLFQYFTNRTWVFDGRTEGVSDFIKQLVSFFGGRLFTLAVEEIIIAVFITGLGLNSLLVKLAAQVVVIVLNYIISKMVVFKN